jgi:hypothetical protein
VKTVLKQGAPHHSVTISGIDGANEASSIAHGFWLEFSFEKMDWCTAASNRELALL